MQLHHINIKAPWELLEQEKEFFCDVLGLQEGHRPNLSDKGYWLYADNNPIVHLSESDAHFSNEKQGFFDHVAFRSTGLQRLIQTLEDKKIKYSTAYLPEIEVTQVFIRAPSNTRIELSYVGEKI